eukprot:TRINITY_DN7094_c0_g1_i1.p1 TRINITY_DN7094_c0_g1~~TRINITY_DN7094_c0_g1_i1.p1  ORF type:complete len:131 (+),score=24.01 TRINITY_DN7094_c0_g1_i1:66-458(+)
MLFLLGAPSSGCLKDAFGKAPPRTDVDDLIEAVVQTSRRDGRGVAKYALNALKRGWGPEHTTRTLRIIAACSERGGERFRNAMNGHATVISAACSRSYCWDPVFGKQLNADMHCAAAEAVHACHITKNAW